MRITRIVLLAVIIAAWVVAVGSLINSFADVSAFPEAARNVLALWPDPDTAAGTTVRFGAVAVLIAGILGYRSLGKVIKRSKQDRGEAASRVVTGQ